MNSFNPTDFKKFIMDVIYKSKKLYKNQLKDEIKVLSEFAKLLVDSTTLSNTFIINSDF